MKATARERRVPRVRRSVDEARRVILEAAEQRLLDGGPDAVRVQAVARDVGMTDAAIHYHFGNRQGLLEAVIRAAGKRLRDDLVATVDGWRRGELDLGSLVTRLRATMDDEGQARLTAWMALGGWKPEGQGLLRPVADTIHERRRDAARAVGGAEPPVDDTLYAIALLGLVAWGESLTGDAWRRSVGLRSGAPTSDSFVRWVVDLVDAHLSAR